MKPKIKNALILLAILIVTLLAGVVYSYAIQKKQISSKNLKLNELQKTYASIENLGSQLAEVEKESAGVDSLLELSPVNIPNKIPEERFFDFVNKYSDENFIYTGVSVEFKEAKTGDGLNYYVYKVYGNARYKDVYNLIYAIEHSRELKRIESAEIKANTVVSPEGVPKYLVAFTLMVNVYFADSERYISSKSSENLIEMRPVYNAYYPLIRSEILPNYQHLPDVQNALLISLVPQGAFIKVSEGNTILMKKGEQVYLGYLTDIDYQSGTATFSLNKGGLMEDLVLELGVKKTGRKL